MHRKLFIWILFLNACTSSNGQMVKDDIESFIKVRAIDTFLIYYQPCIGYSYPADTCQPKDTHYLLWKESNEYFAKKFQTCYTSNSNSIDIKNPLAYYIANRQTINDEEIKQPTYLKSVKKRKTIDTIMVITAIDHSCHYKFMFGLNGVVTKKSADEFDLNFIKFDTGEMNINYEYNQKTKLKKLIDYTTVMTETFDKKDKLHE
jgi:hypothetical protein